MTGDGSSADGTNDGGEPDGDADLPRCPRCDTPVARTTMVGPAEAIAGPCGCRVSPNTVTRSESN